MNNLKDESVLTTHFSSLLSPVLRLHVVRRYDDALGAIGVVCLDEQVSRSARISDASLTSSIGGVWVCRDEQDPGAERLPVWAAHRHDADFRALLPRLLRAMGRNPSTTEGSGVVANGNPRICTAGPTQAVDTGPRCQSTGTFGRGQMARAGTLSGGDGRRGRVEDRKAVARNHELGGGILYHCSADCRPSGRPPTDRHRRAVPGDRLRNWCADPIPSSTGLLSLRISMRETASICS